MGTSLLDIVKGLGAGGKYPFLAAYVNNRIKELNYRVYTPVTVRFIDITHFEGYRVYQRTASFIMQAAVREVCPGHRFYIRHSLGDGFYCEIEGEREISQARCDEIAAAARRIVADNLTITRRKVLTTEAREIYERLGFDDKTVLLETRPRLYSELYTMGDIAGYFYGALAPSTGYVEAFDILPYYNGFYLALPKRSDISKIDTAIHLDKMFDIFHEYQTWVNIMGVPTVGSLNEKVLGGDASELIKIAEAFHEKQLGQIADTIAGANSSRGVRMVLISGPSSSGKTTFAKRLGVQLRVLGLNPVLISLDDYFVEREKTPRDEKGDYDYEALEAIDLAQLNEHLKRLAAGESVAIPRYDFITGKRQWHENPLQLDERSILIMEGIHGLNPRLTPSIPDKLKFKIYISCFTSVAMDNLSRIPTTDNRLLRRITRDYATRGSNAYATIARWGSVRRGEEKHIFPYQENADVMFNSSLFYEISVLRPFVEPILREVPDTVPEYGEASRLLKFLDNFTPVKPDEIPPTSLLREFIGGSSFKY
ncbi:MAG TPA: nucleoside kinase [Candidatus Alistipes excrementipullorum]|nr:nucleoside kinase [Candidatus Alistipes excrementipullorum]